MVERKGVLVTLGEEDGVRSPLLKIWDLEKVDKKLGMGTPVLLRSVKVQTGNRPHPVSLFSVALSNIDSNITGLVDSIIRHSVTPRNRARRWHSPVVPLSRPIHFLVIDLTYFNSKTAYHPRIAHRADHRPRIQRANLLFCRRRHTN
jgi:hypothetical protein